MGKKVKVLIGDDSFTYQKVCANNLRQLGFIVIITARDGLTVFDAIKSEAPDIVVVDSQLSRVDAKGLMTYFTNSMVTPPQFIVTGSYDPPFVEEEMRKHGAVAYLAEPFLLETLYGSIMQCAATILENESVHEGPDLSLIVFNCMQHIGIPASGKSFRSLYYAIKFSIKDPDELNLITKNLYRRIAKKLDMTPHAVERAIRRMIENVWASGNAAALTEYFGTGFPPVLPKRRPSNTVFIAAISIRIRLELGEDSDRFGA